MREIYAITDSAAYERALGETEPLFDHPPEPGSEDEAWLDAMIARIEKYESEQFPRRERP